MVTQVSKIRLEIKVASSIPGSSITNLSKNNNPLGKRALAQESSSTMN